MRLLLMTLSITIIITGCDLPQRQIASPEADLNTQTTQNNNNNNNNNNTGNNNTNTGNNSEYGNCSNNTSTNGGQIGFFGLCKHSSDERKFKVRFAQSSTTGTCFVPSHKYENGASFKLGIAQCVHNQANVDYTMTLEKELTPPNFQTPRTESINAVMVLKASAVNAYMACMHAKESYMLAARVIPGNYASPPCCLNPVNVNGKLHCLQTNQQCENAANNYANQVCSSFTQNYSGQYKLVDTPYPGDNL